MAKVNFFYTRANDYRDVKVDGAIGGPTPTGTSVVMTVYTETTMVPDLIVHEVDDAGVLGPEIIGERKGREGVERRMQATFHMTVDHAKAIYVWLGQQIETLEKGGAK